MSARMMSLDVYDNPTPERRRTAIDLFCGAGGFSLGMILAGIDVLMGIDMDHEALWTYSYNLGADNCRWIGQPRMKMGKRRMRPANDPRLPASSPMLDQELFPEYALPYLQGRPESHPEGYDGKEDWTRTHKQGVFWNRPVKAVLCQDIREVHGWDIFEMLGVEHIDIVFGSPPCQSFSSLGKQAQGDERDYLTFEYARLINEIQPTVVAMENVPQVATKTLPGGRKVLDVLHDLLDGSYKGPTAKGVLGLEDFRYTEGYNIINRRARA